MCWFWRGFPDTIDHQNPFLRQNNIYIYIYIHTKETK